MIGFSIGASATTCSGLIVEIVDLCCRLDTPFPQLALPNVKDSSSVTVSKLALETLVGLTLSFGFFGVEADFVIGFSIGASATTGTGAIVKVVELFCRLDSPFPHLPLPNINDSSSVIVSTFTLGVLVALTLSLVMAGLAPLSAATSSHAKYLHLDCLPFGQA